MSHKTLIRRPDCALSLIKGGSAQPTGSKPLTSRKGNKMRLTNRLKETAATGYILLWLLGIPVPILLLVFLLRGCT
jgi:hypothetical protein